MSSVLPLSQLNSYHLSFSLGSISLWRDAPHPAILTTKSLIPSRPTPAHDLSPTPGRTTRAAMRACRYRRVPGLAVSSGHSETRAGRY